MIVARGPVDLVLILNVRDHGPVHVPHVVPCELREAIVQDPDMKSDPRKCKYNAQNHDFAVKWGSQKKITLKIIGKLQLKHIIFRILEIRKWKYVYWEKIY